MEILEEIVKDLKELKRNNLTVLEKIISLRSEVERLAKDLNDIFDTACFFDEKN